MVQNKVAQPLSWFITRAREEKKLDLSAAAKQVGMPPYVLRAFELGRRSDMTEAQVNGLCQAYGMTEKDLTDRGATITNSRGR